MSQKSKNSAESHQAVEYFYGKPRNCMTCSRYILEKNFCAHHQHQVKNPLEEYILCHVPHPLLMCPVCRAEVSCEDIKCGQCRKRLVHGSRLLGMIKSLLVSLLVLGVLIFFWQGIYKVCGQFLRKNAPLLYHNMDEPVFFLVPLFFIIASVFYETYKRSRKTHQIMREKISVEADPPEQDPGSMSSDPNSEKTGVNQIYKIRL